MNNNDYMYYDEYDFNVAYNNTFSDDEIIDFDDYDFTNSHIEEG